MLAVPFRYFDVEFNHWINQFSAGVAQPSRRNRSKLPLYLRIMVNRRYKWLAGTYVVERIFYRHWSVTSRRHHPYKISTLKDTDRWQELSEACFSYWVLVLILLHMDCINILRWEYYGRVANRFDRFAFDLFSCVFPRSRPCIAFRKPGIRWLIHKLHSRSLISAVPVR